MFWCYTFTARTRSRCRLGDGSNAGLARRIPFCRCHLCVWNSFVATRCNLWRSRSEVQYGNYEDVVKLCQKRVSSQNVLKMTCNYIQDLPIQRKKCGYHLAENNWNRFEYSDWYYLNRKLNASLLDLLKVALTCGCITEFTKDFQLS